jgi:hypothetical protein
MRPRAIPCNQDPQKNIFPIFEYAFVPLGMGFTQPSSTRIEESTDLN